MESLQRALRYPHNKVQGPPTIVGWTKVVSTTLAWGIEPTTSSCGYQHYICTNQVCDIWWVSQAEKKNLCVFEVIFGLIPFQNLLKLERFYLLGMKVGA